MRLSITAQLISGMQRDLSLSTYIHTYTVYMYIYIDTVRMYNTRKQQEFVMGSSQNDG